MRTSWALVLAALLLLPTTAAAKPLYVNNSGSPGCSDATTHADNDADHPWCTLLRAVRGNSDGDRNTPAVAAEAAQAGDTVHVTAGTYDYDGTFVAGGWLEPLYESVNSGTSWTDPIVYQAEGVVELTVGAGVDASTLGGGAEYVKWIGFTVDQATATFRNGLTTITADHVQFENLTLIGTYTALGGDNHAGIMLHGPRSGDCTDAIGDIVIRNCRITGFTGDSGRNDAGMTMYCAAGGAAGPILIEHNEFSSNANGIYAKSSYSPASNDPAVILRKNRFQDNSGSGIMSQAWSNWHVYQNLFIDNTAAAFSVLAFEYYVGGAQPRGYVVANNTLVGNLHGFRLEGACNDASDMLYRNNIAVDSTQHSIWGESADCSTAMTRANYDFDYNLYCQTASLGSLHYIEFTLPTWQSATYDNQDAHSAECVDPLFVDPANDDYTLQAGSPCWEGESNDGVDVLDLDGDGLTDDPITLGAYIVGDEVIGPTTEAADPTCAELGGVCCAVGDTCQGGAMESAWDCANRCCVGGSCEGSTPDAGPGGGGPGDGGGGAGGSGASGPPAAGVAPSDDGCGCAAPGGSGVGGTLVWVSLMLLWFVRRFR